MDKNVQVKKLTKACSEVRITANKTAGWEQWFLLTSDRHHDNAKCQHKLEKRHLDQALERNAGILDIGDMHCAMESKMDRRANRNNMRDEYNVEDYFDELVNKAVDFYSPYAKNWILISEGNHETAVRKKWGTCLTSRTVAGLNQANKTNIIHGGYGGWVNFVIQRHGSKKRFRLKYFHGSGGGGPVTRGVIQTNRQAVYLPDADIIISGHTHDSWQVPIARERINDRGEVYLDEQTHIKMATYKDEYADGTGGWHIERGGPPKPTGGWWLRFYARAKDDFRYEFHRTD
tara:strand:+ start:108 stop:974 length:867 start_codon:yes stop_codon:yes gene_type:complete